MEQKDPKDMTVSELMRVAANRVEMEGNSQGAINCLRMTVGVDDEITYPKDLAKTLSALADKIDAELAQARRSGLERAAKSWAKANGWPDFREGEDFGAWLDRCALPRPRFDDGEPVQFGDDTDELDGVEKFIFLRNGGCCQMQDADGNICNVFRGKRVKRRAPEVLGADGKPIMVGDTVYGVNNGHRYTVMGLPVPSNETVYNSNDDRLHLIHDESGLDAIFPASTLTHTHPDTQQKIDDDALKTFQEYWKCVANVCEECPSMLGGRKPTDYYECAGCLAAQKLDLLRRQRELDKRTGGDA